MGQEVVSADEWRTLALMLGGAVAVIAAGLLGLLIERRRR